MLAGMPYIGGKGAIGSDAKIQGQSRRLFCCGVVIQVTAVALPSIKALYHRIERMIGASLCEISNFSAFVEVIEKTIV